MIASKGAVEADEEILGADGVALAVRSVEDELLRRSVAEERRFVAPEAELVA